jgi:hypothetical protein
MNLAPDCLRILGRRVIVELDPPPIADRRFDYVATFAASDEGYPIGRGRTALAAVADLKDQAEQSQTSSIATATRSEILRSKT